jgi:hypothetical protein
MAMISIKLSKSVKPFPDRQRSSLSDAKKIDEVIMRIGLDFDGTIADTNSIKSEWISLELGRYVPPYLCDRTSLVPIIGEDNYKSMCQQVYSEQSTSRLAPVAGLEAELRKMSLYSDIFLITARGNKMEIVRVWLERQGLLGWIQIRDQPTNHLSKLDVCHALDIDLLVDDDSRHMPPPLEKLTHGILFKPGAPISYRVENFSICRSWKAVGQVAIRLKQRL